MKKAYNAPQSVIYNVDTEAFMAASDVTDDLDLKVGLSQSDMDSSLNPEDNQFTKGNKMWDSQW